MINNDLATLVYNKDKRQYYKKHYRAKYKKRIDYLVGANNELMRELEQWERVRKIDELAPDHLKEGVDYLNNIQRNKK